MRKTRPIRELTDNELTNEIELATALEQSDRAAGLRASTARYDSKTERVVLELTNGTSFGFPIAVVQGLEHATAKQRAAVTLSPSGVAVEWEALNADMSIPGILAKTFGTSLAAQSLGRAGGTSTSEAKQSASRANGAKGGRPRKASA